VVLVFVEDGLPYGIDVRDLRLFFLRFLIGLIGIKALLRWWDASNYIL
jgi:hypothetical protein